MATTLIEQHNAIRDKIIALAAEQDKILRMIQIQYQDMEEVKEHYGWLMNKMASNINKKSEQ